MRLKPNDVAEIRHRSGEGWSAAELAEQYQRTRSHIYRILNYTRWPQRQPYQFPLPLDERAAAD